MTTVITGASGQVGSHLLDALVAQGRRVRILLLPNDDVAAPDGVEIVRGDVRDPALVRSAFEGAQSVFHLAAVISTAAQPGPLLFPVNVGGARNAARAAREAGVRRFVHVSSIVVFDPRPRDRPLDEKRERFVATSSPYTRSKLLGEAAVRAEVARGLDAVIVHPTVIVGPRETHHSGIVHGLFGKQFAGELPALVDGCFNLVDVLDVVQGMLGAEQHGRTSESYILGGHNYRLSEAVAIAASCCERPAPRMRVPVALARGALPFVELGARAFSVPAPYNAEDLAQLAGNPNISSDKARRELQYAPRSIEDAIRRVHAWLSTSTPD